MHSHYFLTLLFASILSSCSVGKKTREDGYYGGWNTAPGATTQPIKTSKFVSRDSARNPQKEPNSINENLFRKIDNLFKKTDTGKCDVIMLTTGEEIQAKVVEITLNEVKYKRCDNLDGPLIYLPKSSVFLIKYPNGTKDIITEHKQVAPAENPAVTAEPAEKPVARKRIEGFGVVGTLLGAIGLIVPSLGVSLLLGLLATCFGIYSISVINRDQNNLGGIGFSIVSLILGLVILGILLLAATML